MIEHFDGVEIVITKNTLKLPHLIASYNSNSGIFSISTGRLIKGNLSAEKVERIKTWTVLNRQKLMKIWENEMNKPF